MANGGNPGDGILRQHRNSRGNVLLDPAKPRQAAGPGLARPAGRHGP